MTHMGYWNDDLEKQWAKEARTSVLTAFAKAETNKCGRIDTMFDDVYKERPKHLQRQSVEMTDNVRRHPEFFPLDMYQP
jgi:2-oxoisovalerate dehydrogenase E1 component alpha subunit